MSYLSHPTEFASSPQKVAIFLATYQGAAYLKEQLDSIAAQTHTQWQVWSSDDGSTDDTLPILRSYQNIWPEQKLFIQQGPRNGYAINFLSLACNPSIEADYFSYCDQDDVWEADKLARAVHWLQSIPDHIPALYCSRTRLINENGVDIGMSPLFLKPASFSNALMQSIAGGNTMVFNRAARELMRLAGPDIGVVTHDWWAYIAVSACGGRVFYDPKPTLRYRQHTGNLIGMNSTWTARIQRMRMLWAGQFRVWNDEHIAALELLQNYITPENKVTLDRFERTRHRHFFARIWGLARCGVYRQTKFGDIGLVFASIFKRL